MTFFNRVAVMTYPETAWLLLMDVPLALPVEVLGARLIFPTTDGGHRLDDILT